MHCWLAVSSHPLFPLRTIDRWSGVCLLTCRSCSGESYVHELAHNMMLAPEKSVYVVDADLLDSNGSNDA